MYYPLTLPRPVDPAARLFDHDHFSGDLRAFYGPQENKVGGTEREERQRLAQWSNTWTKWSDASLLNSTR